MRPIYVPARSDVKGSGVAWKARFRNPSEARRGLYLSVFDSRLRPGWMRARAWPSPSFFSPTSLAGEGRFFLVTAECKTLFSTAPRRFYWGGKAQGFYLSNTGIVQTKAVKAAYEEGYRRIPEDPALAESLANAAARTLTDEDWE